MFLPRLNNTVVLIYLSYHIQRKEHKKSSPEKTKIEHIAKNIFDFVSSKESSNILYLLRHEILKIA